MKKNDFNTIIGFILIGLILYWYGYNTPETTADTTTTESTTAAKSLSTGMDNGVANIDAPTDSLDSIPTQIFYIENEVLKIGITNENADIAEVLLKDYTDYHENPLYLIKNNNSKQSLYLQGAKVDAKYSVQKQTNGELVLQTILEDGTILSKSFQLQPDSYFINSSWSSNKELIAKWDWEMKAFNQEKSSTNENRNTELSYGYDDDKFNYLSAMGDDDDSEENVKWFNFKNQFFNTIVIPENKFKTVNLKSKELELDTTYFKQYTASTEFTISTQSTKWEYYFGPNEYHILSERDDLNLYKNVSLGWGLFGWIGRYLIMPLFDFFVSLSFPVWLSILLVTFSIKILLTPITYKNYVSSAKMRALKPFTEKLNEKYKNEDSVVKQKKLMELYSKVGVNPLAGCIPMLLQLPILLALFRFFPSHIALRHQSFLWADDLSAYDSIYRLSFDIPFYGNHVSLFALLLSVSTLFYTKMTASSMPQSSQPGMPNMQFIMYLMPVMMIFFFNDYSSGLSYYYLMANIINIGQLLFIKKYIVDENKLQLQIAERHSSNEPVKKTRFQKKMDDMMKQSQANKK